MNGLKIVFMGTPDFAVPSLIKIDESPHHIVGIVTQPDRPRGRGQSVLPTPVKSCAQKILNVPILQPVNLRDEKFIKDLRSLRADIFVVVAFRILPESVFMIPPKGTINVHPSLLPKYRGAAPINWTIINGEKETGVTIIKISRQIDAGGILSQEKVSINENETAGSLHERLSEFGANLLLKALDNIEKNNIEIIPQVDAKAIPAPKLSKEICHISFNKPAERVKNWINGLAPYPGAFAYLNSEMIKLLQARVVEESAEVNPPGRIVKAMDDQLYISCNPGIIEVLKLQKAGKKALITSDFLRGFSFKVGDYFS